MPETTLYGTPGTPQSKEPVDKNKLQKSLISLRSTYEKVKPNPRRRRAAFHPWRQSLLMLIIPFLKCLIYSEESHHAYLSWIKAPELTTSPPCFLWDSLILYHVSFTHTHADNRVKQSTLQLSSRSGVFNQLLTDCWWTQTTVTTTSFFQFLAAQWMNCWFFMLYFFPWSVLHQSPTSGSRRPSKIFLQTARPKQLTCGRKMIPDVCPIFYLEPISHSDCTYIIHFQHNHCMIFPVATTRLYHHMGTKLEYIWPETWPSSQQLALRQKKRHMKLPIGMSNNIGQSILSADISLTT